MCPEVPGNILYGHMNGMMLTGWHCVKPPKRTIVNGCVAGTKAELQRTQAMFLAKAIRKFFDLFPSSPGLIRSGQWRVKYNDGNWSRKMTHDTATQYAEMFGGEVHWVRYDDPAAKKEPQQ